jgi:hypothetical protein
MATKPEHPHGINGINSIFSGNFLYGKNLSVFLVSRANKHTEIFPAGKTFGKNTVNTVNAVKDRCRNGLTVSGALLPIEPARRRSSGRRR